MRDAKFIHKELRFIYQLEVPTGDNAQKVNLRGFWGACSLTRTFRWTAFKIVIIKKRIYNFMYMDSIIYSFITPTNCGQFI